MSHDEAVFNTAQTRLMPEVEAGATLSGALSDVTFYVINDPATGTFSALVGDEEIGSITYDRNQGGRVTLISTVVFPDYRGQGVASELIRRVLLELRAEGSTITIHCPIVRTFIDKFPQFADLIDPDEPGIQHAVRPPQRT